MASYTWAAEWPPVNSSSRARPVVTYSIGDVEHLLGVKAHVIRYWEKEVPLIQPEKDIYGRRKYRERDLQILFRLKYLLYERRFTLEGAREQLYRELAGENQDIRGSISQLRSELLNLYFLVHNSHADADDAGTHTAKDKHF